MIDKNTTRPFKETSDKLSDRNAGFADCLGYQLIDVVDTAVSTLTPPKGATIAIIVVIADPDQTDLDLPAIWWREDGDDPTTGDAGEGMPLCTLSIAESKGPKNIKNFKMIGREAGKTHQVRVSYY